MISLFQIILIIIMLFFLSRAIMRYKDSTIKLSAMIFWAIFWVAGIILTIFKDSLNILSYGTNIQRPVDIIVYISGILLFYLIFRLYVRIDDNEQKITILTREIAKKRAKKK